ncbi:MAG: ABC transporter permease [Beutenbergiaceae bacterium]
MSSANRISFASAATIVAKREIMVRLRSKAYIISSAVLLAGIVVGVVLASYGPQWFSSTTIVAATSDAAGVVQEIPDIDLVNAASADEVRTLVADGDVDAGVIGTPDALTVIGDRTPPDEVMFALSTPPAVEILDPNAPHPALAYLVGLGLGIMFFLAAITYGATIAQSVVEEKQTRIVEILLATISARALLAGKIIGNSVLAFAQILLTALLLLGTGAATGNSVIADGLGIPLVWFVVLFTVGFIMLASLYAAAASLVSRAEDVGSATGPIMILVMIPYILITFLNNNPAALAVMSYIPFSAPIAIPMRLFLATIHWWEPVLALVILLLFTVLTIRLAALIYERSLLRTGRRVQLKDVLGSGSR